MMSEEETENKDIEKDMQDKDIEKDMQHTHHKTVVVDG
jgi:hypothetical protein